MILDKWQEEVLSTKGNLCLCSGRQVGKSTVIAIKAAKSALQKKKNIMIISAVERQAYLLFEKVLSYIHINNKALIKTGKDRPTKSKLQLKNGSVIHCLPTGDSGYGIRGFTIDELYADEAHYIHEDVWAAVTPMLATTGGTINLLSTPAGTVGYFYRCFHDKKFKSIHVNTPEVAEDRQEPQRTNLLEFISDEKERMGKRQFQQEYLGMFVGGVQRWFSDKIIDLCCKRDPDIPNVTHGKKYQGIDIARMGGDDTALISVNKNGDNLTMFDIEITNHETLTNTARLIIKKDKLIKHNKIYIDATGMGWGVFDILKEDPQTKRKVIAAENVKKKIDREKGRDKDTAKPKHKEDYYNNLRNLMENGKIELFDTPEIRQSLKSIYYELEKDNIKIWGNFAHITEALIRAAWGIKDKSLKPFIRYI